MPDDTPQLTGWRFFVVLGVATVLIAAGAFGLAILVEWLECQPCSLADAFRTSLLNGLAPGVVLPRGLP